MLWGRLLRNRCLIPGRDEGLFSFLSKAFKLAEGAIQPSIRFKWVLGAPSLEVKWLVVEAGVKNVCLHCGASLAIGTTLLLLNSPHISTSCVNC